MVSERGRLRPLRARDFLICLIGGGSRCVSIYLFTISSGAPPQETAQ
jgi:hypothetical protein